MTDANQNQRLNIITTCVIIAICIALAGALALRSMRAKPPGATPLPVSQQSPGNASQGGSNKGPRDPGFSRDFRDPAVTKYRGRITAVDSKANTVTINSKDQGAITFSVPSDSRIFLESSAVPLTQVPQGDHALVLSKDGKTALDMLARPFAPGKKPGISGGPGQGGGIVVGQPAAPAPAAAGH